MSADRIDESAARFGFGKNWESFLNSVGDAQLKAAEQSLEAALGAGALKDRRFLDVGSGSGVFSLAARRLGARVHSFDFDPASVGCAKRLKTEYFAEDPDWVIEQGSVLDGEYLAKLGTFDIVYSWGVLHHTGALWSALENAAARVAPGGTFFIALYNDEGMRSKIWTRIKRLYVTGPRPVRPLLVGGAAAFFWVRRFIFDTLKGDPFRYWKTYSNERGMSPWTDLIDWVGGYPFEVSKPGEVVRWASSKGMELVLLERSTGCGNNQFVFKRP